MFGGVRRKVSQQFAKLRPSKKWSVGSSPTSSAGIPRPPAPDTFGFWRSLSLAVFPPRGILKNMEKLILSILPEKFGICHFEKKSPISDWALKGEFFSITKTDRELSIVYPQEKIPPGVLFEKDWRAFRIEGVSEGIYVPGIIASLSKPLAENRISIFNISTYQTNYIFVEEKNFKKAKEILKKFCNLRE